MIKCQLKSILKGLNLTQKELCEHINARPSTICALCNVTANQTSGQKNEPRSTSAQILYSVHHNELL